MYKRQSSLYEPYSFLSQIQYAEATGRSDAYYGEERVRAMFDRALQTLSPLGPMTAYCDASWLVSDAHGHPNNNDFRPL